MNKFLSDLLHTHSVSNTQDAAGVIEAYAKTWASHVEREKVGNVYVRENPAQGGILLDAHMDEIGLIVNHITDDGMLHVCRYGGIYTPMYFGHIVRIHTAKGMIYGSVSVKHGLYTADAKPKDIIVDIGAASKEEAESMVQVGDFATFDSDCHELMGSRICGRALDDKSGVYVIMEALRRAKEQGLKTSVTAGAMVGEETTQNGACWAAARLKPSLAVVVDVTFTSDYPHGSAKEDYGDISLGKGPVIGIYPIVNRKHIEILRRIAAENNIHLQYETSGSASCTDADKVHFTGEGVEVVLVSIPLRYMHSPAETADLRDLEDCINLISRFLLYFDSHPEDL